MKRPIYCGNLSNMSEIETIFLLHVSKANFINDV